MKRVLVTGANGLVGHAVRRASGADNNTYFFTTREEADLTKEADVKALFEKYKPEYVIHTAAKVGGIGGNMAGHADYFYQNSLINTLMIHYCHLYNVEKLLAFSSVCVFPDDVVVLREDLMHNGPPFQGNFAYAYAKRMVDVQIRAYRSQYNRTNYCSIIPGNIYGTHDLYNLQHGHVVPSLIHKLFLAKNQRTNFTVWGDGKSLREFILVDDLAQILVRLLESEALPERLLVSGFEQHSIKDVVDELVKVSGFQGNVVFDASKPNGQRNRQSDLTQLKTLFPDFKPTTLSVGLEKSYRWFEATHPNVRL